MHVKGYAILNFVPDPYLFYRYSILQVIQRREGYNNGTRINFTRPWDDYKRGFGNLRHGDFWMGNDFIHALTNDPEVSPTTLRVELEDFEGNFVVAEYSTFR